MTVLDGEGVLDEPASNPIRFSPFNEPDESNVHRYCTPNEVSPEGRDKFIHGDTELLGQQHVCGVGENRYSG